MVLRGAALDEVGGERPWRAAEADERHVTFRRLRRELAPGLADGGEDVAEVALDVGLDEAGDVRQRAYRAVEDRAVAGGEAQPGAHGVERQQDVGEDDRGVDAEAPHRLQGDLGGELGRAAEGEEVHPLAQGAVLGEVAARLPHQPNRTPLGGLVPARPEEEVAHRNGGRITPGSRAGGGRHRFAASLPRLGRGRRSAPRRAVVHSAPHGGDRRPLAHPRAVGRRGQGRLNGGRPGQERRTLHADGGVATARRGRPGRRRDGAGAWRRRLRRQHRLRRPRERPHPRRQAAAAAGTAAAQPRRRHGRAVARRGGARDAAAARQHAGAGALGGAAGGGGGAARAPRARPAAGGAQPRLGGRQRRPRAARAPGAAADRAGQGAGGGRRAAGRRRPRRARPRAARPRGEGRAGAHQRHPGDDGAARPRRAGDASAGAARRPHRRALHRRAARHRRRLRRAAARAAPLRRAAGERARTSGGCCRAPPSATRTGKATCACRTRTACDACRRCTAPAATCSPTSSARCWWR